MDDDELPWHLIIDTPGPNQHPTVNFWEADWFPADRVSSAEITQLATETDPAVVGGFLRVEIIPWEIGETILEA